MSFQTICEVADLAQLLGIPFGQALALYRDERNAEVIL